MASNCPRSKRVSGSVALDFRDSTTLFRPAKAGNLRSDRHAFDLSRRQIRDVTKIHKFEAIFSDEAGAGRTEPRDRFLFLPDNRSEPVATPKISMGEAGLLNGHDALRTIPELGGVLIKMNFPGLDTRLRSV